MNRARITPALVLLPAIGAAAQTPEFDLTLIDLAPGDFANTAKAINNSGLVAGFSNAPGGNRAWRWTDGLLEDIGDTGGVVMRPEDINEVGAVVGQGNDANGAWVGWIWDGGSLEAIPTLGGPGSRAFAINDAGQTVGDAQNESNVWRAMLWSSGRLTDLGTLGGANSQAYAIDDRGRIAGFATNGDVQARAVVWDGDVIDELEQPLGHTDSVAYDLNDSGVAVGSVGDLVSVVLPARWTDDGYEPLAPLPGPETKSFPWAVNEAGHAVGWSQLSFANTVATLWADGVVHDLNDLVQTELDITLTQAWDVNDHGVIVGVGLFEDTLRAWILTPVIAADVTGDGVVDVLDLVEVILGWGPCPDPCPPTCDADIDGNCTVDVQDLVAVILGWS